MGWQEFTLTALKVWKGKLHHKIALVLIGSGLTIVAGSTVAMLAAAYIEHLWGIKATQTPFWAGVIFVAGGLWIIWPEINKARQHPPHPHDVELLRNFRSRVDARTRDFLRDREFFAPIPRYPVVQLEAFNEEWRGALFEFRDTKVQAALQRFYRAVNRFLNDFQYTVWTMDNNPDFYTVKNRVDEQRGLTKETEEKVARMSKLALGRISNWIALRG